MWAVGERSAWLEAVRGHGAARGDEVAIVEASAEGEWARSWTWRELNRAIEKCSRVLGGVREGNEVATVLAALPSGVELAAWFGGAIEAGVQLAMMHPRSGAGEFATVRGRTRARAVLAGEELLSKVGPEVRRLGFETERGGLEKELAGARVQRRGSIVLGSSGTTGLPKLVIRESPALDADAKGVADGLGLTSADRVLCVPPLCHSYGVDLLLGTLCAGATLVVVREFDPAGAAKLIAEGVTVLPGVPFVFEALSRVEAPGSARIRTAVSAGTALSPRVREEFSSRWNVEIGQLYGATELGTVSLCVPGTAEFDPESIGRPLEGVTFRVVDVDDPTREVADGEEGQLAVRAASMLSGYVDGEAELVDGHLLTGDLARRDSQGRHTITGRLKLLIDSGGFKVNPLEVEHALSEHPGVAECAVVGLALSDTIQRLFAFVVAKEPGRPPGDRELRAFLRERLAPTKIPRGFRLVEKLPRSAMGKLLRDQLPTLGDPWDFGGEA